MNINSEQEMINLGKRLAKSKILGDNMRQDPSRKTVIELIGDVGTGKTTFTRGLAEGLGIKEEVTSPSFTISKSYAFKDKNGKEKTLVHYDFYRLPDPGLMAEDLAEKIKDKNNIIVVEWANTVDQLLPQDRIIVEIKKNDNDTREIEIKDNWNSTFRDISRPTGNELARSPVITGATKRVEKNAVQLSLYLDTSTPETILKLNDHEYRYNFDRDLAEKLLKFIHDKLAENGKTFSDLTEITFMSGPGSFTGLRIGASIVNTLATELNIPLYDHEGNQVKIILPNYGRGANISTPRK